ncbi:MAG: hypothetical protein QOF78_4048, partial [Phycisphaerales bacterium]|nr:hypothetical protein [Phycisphaerales bacterium]
TLWDNLDVNGQAIDIQNRGNLGSGHGWAGANQVVWNSAADKYVVQSPPAAQNWLIGSIGTNNPGTVYVGPHDPGIYDSHGTNVDTRSLYYAQLADRLRYENLVYRELRVGDHDNYVNDGAVDTVAADAAWKTKLQTVSSNAIVGFDTVAAARLVPFTFNFTLAPGEQIVGASLNLGLKSASGSTSSDRIYFEDTTRSYKYADLGLTAPGTSAASRVIDLSKILAALQDGKLNVAIDGNTAVDWAVLNLRTASTVQPNQTTLNPVADALVRDGTSAASNFGTAATIDTKLDVVNNNRESFLKFDLNSTVGYVTRATLRLVPASVGYASQTTVGVGAMFNQIAAVADDTWTETGINWNNKPAAGASFGQFVSFLNAPLNIDVTSLVQGALAGDKTLSLKLLSITQNTSGQISLGSRENGNANFRPQLILQTYNGLLPVADAYVRDGTSAALNFGATPDLGTKKDATNNNQEGFLKFDLNGFATSPINATVRLIPQALGSSLVTNSGAFVSTDTWTEAGITWNTKPASSTSLGSWVPRQATPAKMNVTSQAASAFASDKLLSVKISSDTTSSTGLTQYASREHPDGMYRPLVVSTNLGPKLTSLQNLTGTLNAATPATWFGVWDAETAAGSLTVTGTSSNTALLPNANISFTGSGSDRFVTLTPAAGQFGTTTVTITTTDAQGQSAFETFQYVVANIVALDGDQTVPNQNDIFKVIRSGSFLDIFRNDMVTPVVHVDYATAPTYAIHSLGGDDQLLIDLGGGNPISAAGLEIDGGSGNDFVSVIGGGGADAVSLINGDVTIASTSAAITGGVEELRLALGAGADTLAAAGNASVATGAVALNVAGGGSLAMTAGSTLPDFTDVTVSGATFNLNGQAQTIDTLSGAASGIVTNSGALATLTIGQQNGSGSFGGNISGALALTKIGSGTLTLSGANSYSGLTTITAGTIASGNAASLAGTAGQVMFNGGTFRVTADTLSTNVANKYATNIGYAGAGGTFNIDAGVTLTIGTAGGSGSLRTNGGGFHGGEFTKTGAGTLRILSNNGQLDDPLNLNQGTVIAESATALGGADNANNHLDMKSGTTLVLRQNVSTNFLTPISIVDPGATVNVVIDRQSAGSDVTHSMNAITAAGAFTLNLTRGANVTSGIGGLSVGAMTLSGDGTFNVGGNASFTNTATLGGNFSVTKTGAGSLVLSGANSYTGATTVNDGAMILNGNLTSTSAVVITGGLLQLAPNQMRVIKTPVLTIVGTGKLDLTDNKLIVAGGAANIGSPTGGVYSGVTGLIQSGMNGGTWDGVGLITSQGDAATGLTTLGIATADATGYAGSTFGGVAVGAADLLVMYTYSGDANLDGFISGDDYSTIDFNVGTSADGYYNGDFNYDGIVSGDDYSTIDFNFAAQGPPLPL